MVFQVVGTVYSSIDQDKLNQRNQDFEIVGCIRLFHMSHKVTKFEFTRTLSESRNENFYFNLGSGLVVCILLI